MKNQVFARQRRAACLKLTVIALTQLCDNCLLGSTLSKVSRYITFVKRIVKKSHFHPKISIFWIYTVTWVAGGKEHQGNCTDTATSIKFHVFGVNWLGCLSDMTNFLIRRYDLPEQSRSIPFSYVTMERSVTDKKWTAALWEEINMAAAIILLEFGRNKVK